MILSRRLERGLLTLLLLLGLGLRLYDLTDAPLDFHPTRQLRGAIIARAIYYRMLPNADPEKRALAEAMARIPARFEPPILETLTALGYLVAGGEHLWIARLVNTALWLLGGLGLYALARAITGPFGALLSLGYYLVLPFGVTASRSFQPDPGMTVWMVLSVWALYRWREAPSWRRALIAGALGGLAALTKVVIAPMIGIAALVVVLQVFGWRRFWRQAQVWGMAGLMIVPAAWHYILASPGNAGEYTLAWGVKLWSLLRDPGFYVRWLSFESSQMGFTMLILAALGLLLFHPRDRLLVAGLWVGFVLYGLALPHQITTHNYYHIQFVPVVALSLAPIGEIGAAALGKRDRLARALAPLVMLVALAYPAILVRNQMAVKDYRQEGAAWATLATQIPDGRVIALTQSYGYPLMYYGWRRVDLWPVLAERKLATLRGRESDTEFQEFFKNRTRDADYFVITFINDLERQSDLKAYLEAHYPLIVDQPGLKIYRLRDK